MQIIAHRGCWTTAGEKNTMKSLAQPTLISKGFYKKWKEAPYDFSLDLYAYYLASIKLIKRVLTYSAVLKRDVRKQLGNAHGE